MIIRPLLRFFWLRNDARELQADLIGRRFSTLIIFTSMMSLVAGLASPTLNLNIVLGAAALILVGLLTVLAIHRGWGQWARPLMVVLVYGMLYTSRVTNARPLMHADNSFVLMLFVTLLLPYLMIERRRWGLQLVMVCAIILSLIKLDWSIAQFGAVYQPEPTIAIQYTRWAITSICIIGSFSFFNNEIVRNERKNSELLAQMHHQNAELATQAEELKSLQDELLKREKIKAMDRIMARVSHQINSPLGALYSAVQQSGELARTVVRQIAAGDANDTHRRWLIEDMLQRAERGELSQSPHNSFKQRRNWQASVLQQLQQQNTKLQLSADDWNGWADALSEVQLPQQIPTPYLQPEARSHLPLLANISAWVRNNWVEYSTVLALRSLSLNLRAAMGGQSNERPLNKNINEVVAEVLKHYAEQHPGCKLHISLPQPAAQHRCIKSVLDTILYNLLSNAADATASGGQVWVALQSTPTQLILSVADDGPGVVPQLQPMLFQPFFTTKERGLSMGLGLYVVRQVVQGQGGHIHYSRNEGRTVFTATLPWAQAT